MTAIERRTFLKGVGGLAGAVILGGCSTGTTTASRPTFVQGRPLVRVKSWGSLGYPSPFTYVAGPGYWRMSLLFDTLTWPDSTGTQLPWLASSYTRSDDGLVWKVEMRDVKFFDGAPVTSKDVVFTYDYYTSRTFTPLLTGVPRKGVEVVATGERSVEFRLNSPEFTFLQSTLGTMPIVPEHIFSDIADPQGALDKRTFVGNGAYQLVSKNLNSDNEAYEARDDYYLGRPYVRRIEMIGLPDDDELAALKAGHLDGAGSPAEGVRNERLAPFRNNPTYDILTLQSGFGFPLFFNQANGFPMNDVRFRRAIVHAIDRNDLIQRLLTGNGTMGSAGWLPPTNPYYTADGVREYPFDRAEAERLLDELGLHRTGGANGKRTGPNGKPLEFTLTIPTVIPLALSEFIVANLGAVGITVKQNRLDLPRVYGAKIAPKYDFVIDSYPGPAGIGPNGDPDQLRGVYYSNPPSQTHKATGYSNPEVDRLIDAQLATYDIEQRKGLVGQIQRIVSEDLPVAMLYYTTWFWVFKPAVFDAWYYTPGGFATGLSDIYNKQAYITGRKTGTEIRPV